MFDCEEDYLRVCEDAEARAQSSIQSSGRLFLIKTEVNVLPYVCKPKVEVSPDRFGPTSLKAAILLGLPAWLSIEQSPLGCVDKRLIFPPPVRCAQIALFSWRLLWVLTQSVINL